MFPDTKFLKALSSDVARATRGSKFLTMVKFGGTVMAVQCASGNVLGQIWQMYVNFWSRLDAAAAPRKSFGVSSLISSSSEEEEEGQTVIWVVGKTS